MGSSIILDTNAVVYLSNIEKGKENSICVEGKQVKDAVFFEFCKNAENLYVTGQTLFELLWQSLEHEDDDYMFDTYNLIAGFKRKYGVPFTVINDINCMFNLEQFQDQYKTGKIDVTELIEQKMNFEIECLQRLLFTMYCSSMAIIVDYAQVDFGPQYYSIVHAKMHDEIAKIAWEYYSNPKEADNKIYDKEIERILADSIKEGVEYCRLLKPFTESDSISLPPTNSENSGTVYLFGLFNRLKKQRPNIYNDFENNLNDVGVQLINDGEYEDSVKFLKYICFRSVENKVKIRKNDGLDFSILTCLAKDHFQNETSNSFNEKNTFMLTFDKKLYTFSKEQKVLYNKAIYDALTQG